MAIGYIFVTNHAYELLFYYITLVILLQKYLFVYEHLD